MTNNLQRLTEQRLNRTLKKLEKARSALKVIQTWATFEYEGLPIGHALVPWDVQNLCEKTLKETE